MYDYLIVGAGLFGATFAWHAKQARKSVLIIDSRDHIGGNCFTYKVGDIDVHRYGPHTFHCSSEKIWKFVNQFAEFEKFSLRVKALNGKNILSMPINMMTLHQVFGVVTLQEAEEVLKKERIVTNHSSRNLEEWALSQVGNTLYEKLIRGYTKKQWGREPSKLPAAIIKRIPIRLTWNDDYHNDAYQGIPKGGYTQIFEQMLSGCEVQLNVDFFDERQRLEKLAHRIIYTGQIDRFYNDCFGQLEYRSLEFTTKFFDKESYQGMPQLNFSDEDVTWTRRVEHKYLSNDCNKRNTVVTWEKSVDYAEGLIPFYPVNDETNGRLVTRYKELALKEKSVLFGGRLASYRYVDMHVAVGEAIALAKKEFMNETT